MIRVLIAEDQAMVRGALASLLGLEQDIEVVAEVDRGDRVLAAASHDTASAIAAELHLAEGTVRNYLSAAIRKLGVRNRREAIERANEKGWF
jgi:DNA-binding NarL/FixJ family response regulator